MKEPKTLTLTLKPMDMIGNWGCIGIGLDKLGYPTFSTDKMVAWAHVEMEETIALVKHFTEPEEPEIPACRHCRGNLEVGEFDALHLDENGNPNKYYRVICDSCYLQSATFATKREALTWARGEK